jgi:transcriptional regulator with XRE-family HTH domain
MQREIRKAAGVSQAQVAAELGVQRVTVARWETGLRKPSPRLLERYVELLEQLREAAS